MRCSANGMPLTFRSRNVINAGCVCQSVRARVGEYHTRVTVCARARQCKDFSDATTQSLSLRPPVQGSAQGPHLQLLGGMRKRLRRHAETSRRKN
jgi:hypothetical protein